MPTQIITKLSYSNIFNDKPKVKDLLLKINFQDGLKTLSHINLFNYKFSDKDGFEIKFILKEWLIQSDENFKNKILDEYSKHLSNKDLKIKKIDFSSVRIINKLATLRTIQILLTKTDKKQESIKDSVSFENLFKLYLIVNDEINERQNLVFKKWFKTDKIRLHLYLGLTSIYEPDNLVFSRLFSEILKLLIFEKWIRKSDEFSELVNIFLNKIEEKSLYEYFNKLFHLSKFSINENYIRSSENQDLETILEYLSKRTEKNTWDELISLKSNPIYKLNLEEYLILDNTFLIDKFFSGVYHDLIKISKEIKINFHQKYSKEFAEEYLLESALKSTFRNSYIQFSEKKIKEKGNKIESLSIPDYYIRNGNKVMLFEFKNSFLSNANKINLNFNIIENEIIEKFYKNKNRKKAIKQLVGYITNTIKKKYAFFDDLKKYENLRFYPILVVTDKTLSSIGFNKLLNEYFDNETKDLNFKNRIKPLTLIDIDTFLYFNRNIKKLDLIIDDYHCFLIRQIEINSMISFNQYLKTEKFKDYSVKFGNVDDILKDSLLPK
ncbi:hypothetical protein BW723_08205 [Polaribacter reichenbachii]|uniref:Uncharacterized protein n=1 Tax=Polaribacter reichenbachii TaxID=996801 RepID=A0A1B8U6Z6_9FLAO|nr:hypothetical protein [Polaribacter reichenbachii]APZ46279.1 hypothetical protein BW723_08205 [Polaribacter reichenbachii]AUC20142.1 hypothetical protein BTO17_16225 [Polaribacter reichenbachii]OBY67599.1 hypothetical protein LPB301_01285 [Polaribacter reichenbachii]